jgi:hypothetical protein
MKMKTDVLGKLIHALQEARIEFSAEDLADVLWLAPHLQPRADAVQSVREALHFELDAEPAQPPNSTRGEFTDSKPSGAGRDQTVTQQEGVGAYLPFQDRGSSERLRGIPVHLPDAAALPHALWIARALKPLRRRQQTKRILLMNEIRTAEQLAVSDIWFPSLFPGKERWLSAALVIDIGASMAIWQNVIGEFRRVLISLGAFRKLEQWWLDTEDPAWTRKSDSKIPLFGSQRSRMYRKPLDIVHSCGRQIIFVVSDCVSDAWWDDRAAQLLALWGKTSHTVLLQVLPESMWERTALTQHQKIVLRSQRAGGANSDIKALVKTPFRGLVSVPETTVVPMPILELEAGALGAWSKWVVEDAGGMLPGRALEYCRPAEQVRLVEESDDWAHGPGQPFLTVASRTARKLANIMAVAPPFNLPLLRVIRESMLGGEATQVHEAEFLLSGLVKVVDGYDRRFDQPNDVLYDFQTDELRKLFRAAVKVPDALDLLRIEKVSQFLGQNLGQRSSFPAYLASPAKYEGAIDLGSGANREPIARFTKDILQWFGPPYDRLVGSNNSLSSYKDETIDRTSSRSIESDVPEEQAKLVLPAKWILVVGTGLDDLPQAVVKSADRVGRWLGSNRYGLITGGWKGVDYVVARSFAHALRDAGLPVQKHLVHVVRRGRTPKFGQGQRVYVDDYEPVYERSVALADGVILIGGRDLTRSVGEHTLAVHKPLYPLASTGGVAQKMHAEMLATWTSIGWHPMSREEFLTLHDEEQTLDPIKHSLNRLDRAASQQKEAPNIRPVPTMSREEFLTLRDEEQTLDPIKHSLNRLNRAASRQKEAPNIKPVPTVEVLALSENESSDIRSDPSVEEIVAVMPIRSIGPVQAPVPEPGTASPLRRAWGVEAVGAHRSPFSGSGVTVAILTEGIDTHHPTFRDVNITLNDFTDDGDGDLDTAHGTHVAATILGRDVDGVRVGIAPGVSRLVVAKVMDRNGGSSAMLVKGLEWASHQQPNIIALFLGFDYPGMVDALVKQGYPVNVATAKALTNYTDNLRLFEKLLDILRSRIPHGRRGPLIIVPAGNESNRQAGHVIDKSFPGTVEGVISVGALREMVERSPPYELADFSNGRPSITAPGVDIISARAGGGLMKMSGTSMAAAHAAGVAALWAEKLMRETGSVNSDRLASQFMSAAKTLNLSDVGAGLISSPLT